MLVRREQLIRRHLLDRATDFVHDDKGLEDNPTGVFPGDGLAFFLTSVFLPLNKIRECPVVGEEGIEELAGRASDLLLVEHGGNASDGQLLVRGDVAREAVLACEGVGELLPCLADIMADGWQ